MAVLHSAGWRFDNTYARLPELFFARVQPTPVGAPKLVVLNRPLAGSLGLDPSSLEGEAGALVLSGNTIPPGAEPIAQAYAGHQFGHLNMLGDGRAALLGEQLSPVGARFDLQLKGSGQTPFSRRGDGRAALGPMLREYIISEAMHFLRIPTTRSLAVVATGEAVNREESLPGAVLTRVAASHIRVGTFEYAAQVSMQGESDAEKNALRTLADYTIARHYPELGKETGPDKYLAFLRAVIDRQAKLIANWIEVGFIHGVMNTDNMALSGETIDYGPCAFMDSYSPGTVFSSIDRDGRYAFGNQPRIGAWNLARFAETLLPLLGENREKATSLAKEAVDGFGYLYEEHFLRGLRRKLGLFTEESEDEVLFASLLSWMERNEADYTNTFRALSRETLPADPFYQDTIFRAWHERWKNRLTRQEESWHEARVLMRTSNPDVIPRNHQVEAALAAALAGDLSVMEKLLVALRNPYEDDAGHAPFHAPAPESSAPYRTFCGT